MESAGHGRENLGNHITFIRVGFAVMGMAVVRGVRDHGRCSSFLCFLRGIPVRSCSDFSLRPPWPAFFVGFD